MNALLEAQPGPREQDSDGCGRPVILPATFGHKPIRSMETEIGLWALRTGRPMSSRFTFNGSDRSHQIVDSVGITALRLNCTLVSSLTYHDNGRTINKHVEAEGRTSPAIQDNGTRARRLRAPSNSRSGNPQPADASNGPSATAPLAPAQSDLHPQTRACGIAFVQ
jgi:hypothetical protein